jgi:uncharacterized membrane protein HdeD (DUF308 family)
MAGRAEHERPCSFYEFYERRRTIMSDTNNTSNDPLLLTLTPVKLERGWIIGAAIVGIVLGILALVWPGATLLTVAILFGSYLIVSGVFRLTVAFTAHRLSTGMRWFIGVLGGIVVLAGIFCLSDPAGSLLLLALVIGIGWIMEGIADIAGGAMGTSHAPRWLAILSGVVSVIAGIVIFFLPGLALATFVLIGAILLIVVSVTTLLTLPRTAKTEGAAAPTVA